jgi:hypothetical protein
VAKISGQTFEDYIADHILNPLHMNNSSLDLREIDKTQLAAPHLLCSNLDFAVSDTIPYSRNHVGCGTLFSTVEDLGRFAMWALQVFHSDDESILSDSALGMMWTPIVELSEQQSQGLSWIIWKEGNHILYEHSGGDPGYRCDFVVVPGDSVAVVTMSNSWEHDFTSITMMAVRILLGTYERDCQESTRGRLWKAYSIHGADSATNLFSKIMDTEGADCLHPAHLNQIGSMLIDLRRYDDACKLKEFNAGAYPHIRVLKVILADLYLQAGNKSACQKVCKEILANDPDNKRVLEILHQLNN